MAKTKDKDTTSKTKGKKVKDSSKTKALALLDQTTAFDYNMLLDDIEKTFDLSSSQLAHDPRDIMPTNLLVINLMLGGGIRGGGWYTFFGPEQSAKSTLKTEIESCAAQSDVPVIADWDYEGSSQGDYMTNIMVKNGVRNSENLFGLKDPKTGEWLIRPRIRYYTEGIAEKFFRSLAKMEREVPQIRKVGDNQFYVFEKDNKKILKMLNPKLVKDEKLSKKLDMVAVACPAYVRMQGLVLVDSYPGMLPERYDEDDKKESMAAQALMFATELKKVKGRMKSRRITVVGINQLRLRPGVMYGNPEYEPAGEALKLYCFAEDTLLFTSKGILDGKTAHVLQPKYLTGAEGRESPSLYKHMGIHPVGEVKLVAGYSMKGRHEHRVFALRSGTATPEWVKIEDLTKEHYVAVKSGAQVWSNKILKLKFGFKPAQGQGTNQYQVEPSFPTYMTLELARLIGYLVGEGHVRENRIIFSTTDYEVYQDYNNCLQATFKLSDDYLVRKQKLLTNEDTGNSVQYISDIYSTQLGQFFTYLGISDKRSREKDVPWCIMQSCKDHLMAFMSALFEGEGAITPKELHIHSSSPRLMKQVHMILLNAGVLGKYEEYKSNWMDLEFEDRNKYAHISIYGCHIDSFAEQIGFISDRKVQILEERLELVGKSKISAFDIIPSLFSWREKNKRFRRAVDLTRGRGKHLRLSKFTPQVFKVLRDETEHYRTKQERDYSQTKYTEIFNLISVSQSQELIWSQVSDVRLNMEPTPVYDCCMPNTHTILTDGIVSHNSDVRIKCTPRAVPHGKGQFEEEESITGEGNDTYRYIHWKATKNKLSVPNLEGWGRIWVSDVTGKAWGFDPVWDCLAGDTRIATSKGNLRVEDFLDHCTILDKNKQGVHRITGLQALSNDGKLHDITKWGKKGVKDIYTLTTHHGHVLRASANEQIQVITASGDIVWKRLINLDFDSDYVIVSKGGVFASETVVVPNCVRQAFGRGTNHHSNTLDAQVELTSDMAYLLGYLIADGSFGPSGRHLAWYTSSPKAKTKLIKLIKRTFNYNPSVYTYKSSISGKDAYDIRVNSVEVGHVFMEFGLTSAHSADKFIPDAIWRSPKEVVLQFLQGLYSGDGSIGKGDFSIYSSSSTQLIQDVTLLLWSLGVTNQRTKCSGYAAREFKEIVGKCSVKELANNSDGVRGVTKAWDEKLPMHTGYRDNFTFHSVLSDATLCKSDVRSSIPKFRESVIWLKSNSLRCSRINSIEHSGEEMTYDIEVKDTHNLIANGIVVHNCYQYAKSTGQVSGTRNKLRFACPQFDAEKKLKALSWLGFKTLVLGTKDQRAEVFKEINYKGKDFLLRKVYANQLIKGEGLDLFYAHKAELACGSADSEDDD